MFLTHNCFQKLFPNPKSILPPNFLFSKISLEPNIFFKTQIFRAKNFQTRNFNGSKNIYIPKFLRTHNFFRPIWFFRPNFSFQTKIFFGSKIFFEFFFWPKIFLDKETTGVCRQWQKLVNYYLTFLWLELFCYFLRVMTFPVVSFVKPSQAEHFRLESCFFI